MTGPFTVEVSCEYPEQEAQIEGHGGPFVTTLVFNPDGTPQSASEGGWQNTGTAWSYTGEALKNKLCTATETDSANAIAVSYACDFTSTPFEQPESGDNEVGDESRIDADPGCAGDNAVQFTHPWDDTCEVLEPDEVGAEGKQQCQQAGVITVTNTFDEAEAAAVVVEPNFTG